MFKEFLIGFLLIDAGAIMAYATITKPGKPIITKRTFNDYLYFLLMDLFLAGGIWKWL